MNTPHYVQVSVEGFELPLTPSQYAHLQPGKRIGCGSSACAYERPDGRVVKFTWDDKDVHGAIVGRKADCAVVRVDEAYRLPQRVNGEPVFATIGERLQRLPPSDPRRVWLLRAQELIGDYAAIAERPLAHTRRMAAFRLGNRARRELVTHMCGDRHGQRDPACRRFALKIARLAECMGRQGLAVDDIRVPNVGLDARGKLRLLDVSHSDIAHRRAAWAARDRGEPYPSLPDPSAAWPMLEGQRRRACRRR